MQLSYSTLQEIADIASQEERLRKAADAWWDTHIAPKINECQSWEEADKILSQIPHLPGTLKVKQVFVCERFSGK